MTDLPAVTAAKAIRVFEKLGFELDRIKGAHHILKKAGHPYVLSVPVHRGNLKPGLLRALIRGAGITVEQFVDAL